METIDRCPAFITPAELATILRCTRRHIYDLIGAGVIPCRSLGSGKRPALRIPTRELGEFVTPEEIREFLAAPPTAT